MIERAWFGGLGMILVLSACGSAGGGGGVVPGPTAEVPPPGGAPPDMKSKFDQVAQAKVYDEKGNAAPCSPPRQDCPAVPVERAFLDRCRLAGFQVRQCGCASRCSGDVSAAGRRYDAGGQAKECAPAKEECTPPQASGAFQDACTEKGYRLEVCGCEWLCSGNPVK